MALFGNIKNPKSFKNRDELEEYLKKKIPEYADIISRIQNLRTDNSEEAIKQRRALSSDVKPLVDEHFRKLGIDGILLEDDYSYNKDAHIHNTRILFSPNQVKSATDNNGEFSRENDDIQMAIGKRKSSINNSLSEQEKRSIRTLLKTINRTGTTLLDNGEGTMYLLDHADREDIENRNPKKEDGFNCRLKFSTEGYTKEDINTIREQIDNGNIRDQDSFDKWAKSHLDQQGRDNSDSIDAEDRAANADNDRLDLQTSEGESRRGQGYQNSQENLGTGFIKVYNNDGTNGPRYIPVNAQSQEITQYFTTPQGEVYGFVTPEGEMYLDENIITSEHPIHEYTHIWDRVVAKNNSRLWQRGVELMKQTSLWKEIEEDKNYGKKWKASSALSPEEIEFRIASSSELSFVKSVKSVVLLQ